jgi:hypothetical protein
VPAPQPTLGLTHVPLWTSGDTVALRARQRGQCSMRMNDAWILI